MLPTNSTPPTLPQQSDHKPAKFTPQDEYDVDEVEAKLQSQFEEMLTLCRSAHSPSFAEFEATLFSMLMSLGCLFVALFLRIQHQSFDPDSYLKRTGGRLKTAARRILRTGFGKVAYWRSYIEPKNKKKGQGFSRKPKGAGRCKCGCQRHRGKACRNKKGKRKRRKKGDKSKNGRSITLVAIYTLKRGKDGLLHGPINKRIWGSYAPRSVMMDWAEAEVKRRGFDPTGTNVHIVSDGENSFIASTGPGTKTKREKLRIRKTIAYLRQAPTPTGLRPTDRTGFGHRQRRDRGCGALCDRRKNGLFGDALDRRTC